MQRLNRALRTLSAGNRTLLRASNELDLLQDMCRVIVCEGGYRMSCVAYARQDEQKTFSIEACGLGADADREAETVLRSVVFTWGDTELGRSPGGIAVRTGQPCIGRNVLTDPDLKPWRADALQFGYASVTAFPLSVEGEIIGALGICAAEPDAFDQEEVELLGELAEDLAYGIGNLRTRCKHREAESTIRRLAYYDTLTGLANRSLLLERLQLAVNDAHQQHRPLALLFLHLEHLGEINDTLGYTNGDLLQQEVARRLLETLGEEICIARVGDGEFAVLFASADADLATQVAQKLIALFEVPIEIRDMRLDARISVGTALFPGHGENPDVLLRRGRVAMMEAKRSGRSHALYSIRLDENYANRIALMGDLRHAIEHNHLTLFCQPKAHVASGGICGAEALVRWRHHSLGMLATGNFVEVAEFSGLITPLTLWVLENAFRHRHAWHKAGIDLPLSVNLSAHDLRDPRLPQRIEGLMATWGAEPDWIEFELTESAVMEDPDTAISALYGLRQFGMRLFVDDFGVGHSSLSYLQKLPVDGVKIDQSLVAPMLKCRSSATIVGAAVKLGHDLGLEVVAEGVESQSQWEQLSEMGCDVAQGYYISKPMPAENFAEWQRASGWHV